MYKHLIITILLGSTLACSGDTEKNSEKDIKTISDEVTIEKVDELVEETKISDSPITDLPTEKVDENNNSEITEIVKTEDTKTIKEVIKETVKEEVKAPEIPKVVSYSPSHSSFDALLKKYVSTTGKVNYAGIKTEITKLDEYLFVLAKNAPKSSFTKEEKLAYWINLYNAGTIKLILNNYPTNSIMDINGGKAWDVKFIKSGTRILSLNQIENDIIRPTFKEPRIHFAVNCAAVSCPKILNGAFYPHILDKQLDAATKKFINNKAKNTITESSIKISKIFDWYAVDFGGKENLITFFNKYSNVKINNNATVSFQEYKWGLNN